MGYSRSAIAAILTLGCATTPDPIRENPRIYVASAETTRSESSVTSCARSRIGQAGHLTGRTENSAYGPGPVSDFLSYRTSRVGDKTVLMVTARSYVFPQSGRGAANSNTVAIPVTQEAKDRVTRLIDQCAESLELVSIF